MPPEYRLGLTLIKVLEGLRLNAYWDRLGKCWTIGYGHTGAKAVQGAVWTEAEAEAALIADLQPLIEALAATNPRRDSPASLAGMLSFGHNCGIGALNRLLKGSLAATPKGFISLPGGERFGSVGANGQFSPALHNRRLLEANLIVSGALNGR